jgi:hypothetical protein
MKRSSTHNRHWQQWSRSIGFVVFSVFFFCPSWAQAEGTVCGTYRGTVVSAADPLLKGRVQVNVPALFGGEPARWAFPNVPFGRVQLPTVGEIVWVTFEACDLAFPIWTGTPTVHCKNGPNGLPRGCQTEQ